ncbi:hypothetical protein AF72_11020 [Xylella taiwanensis]|nr:hypothetical protein AF72_11020 [Xylella taiwanensis]
MGRTQVSQRFEVTQRRISNVIHGKINICGLDALAHMVMTSGRHFAIACP